MKDMPLEVIEKTVPSPDTVLGAVYDSASKTCRFSVWAPTAQQVTVQIYRDAAAAVPVWTIPLVYERKTGVWSGVFSDEDPELFFYDYAVRTLKGTKQVLDPYAYSMAACPDDGSMGRAAIVDLSKPALQPIERYPYPVLAKREDAVIYEISVRDFTVSPDSGVQNIPGTYTAFIEKIPYLKHLGITHIQLMPVLRFYAHDETKQAYEDSGTVRHNNYNWGYDPHNYFTPEGWYSSDPHNPECRIAELRELINACHKENIGVILDVVYNHMAKTDFLEALVPGYYFRTRTDGTYTNASGCGNDLASERIMVRKLIVDSLVHWVKAYKADGFRFDLMGLLDTETVLSAYNACAKINPSVLFIGEGWKMYNGASGTAGMDQRYMTETDSVAVFNDEFRDLLKAGGMNEGGGGFLTMKQVDLNRLYANCLGDPAQYYRADSPGDNVQYAVCHDGLTLRDSIAHAAQLDDTTAAGKKELVARIKMGNMFVLTSQGIAFLHGGQERGRTKPNIHGVQDECVGAFVRNSYDAADSVNRFVWTLDPEYQDLVDYTAGLIALRKEHEVFRIGDAAHIQKAAQRVFSDDSDGLSFGYRLKRPDGLWFLLWNTSYEKHRFELECTPVSPEVFADRTGVYTQGNTEYSASSGLAIYGSQAVVAPCTSVIFRCRLFA